MKKLWIMPVLALLVAGAWIREAAPQDPARVEYHEWVLGEMKKIRAQDERKEGKDPGEPDQFFIFDRLKRVNPITKELPPFGYQKALREIEKMEDPSRATNYGLDWEERGPTNVGGRTRAFIWDANDSFNRAAFTGGVGGGLWYTPDVTTTNPTWINVNPMFSNVAVTTIAQDPTNPNILYFGTGEGNLNADAIRGAGIWKSTDGGATWNVLPSTETATFYYTQKIVINSAGEVFAGTKGGLMKSTNQGVTWVKCLGTGTGTGTDWITDLAIAADGDLFAAISSSGIYRCPPGTGQGLPGSWTKLNVPFGAGYARIILGASPSDANRIYALSAIGFSSFDKVYRTTDGGNTWTATATKPGGTDFTNGQAWYDLSVAVAPTDPDLLYVGGLDIYRSVNGGDTWARRSAGYNPNFPVMHVDQHGVIFRPGQNTQMVFTNDGGIYYSSNGTSSIGSRNSGYNVTQFYTISVDPRPGNPTIIGGTQDNGTQKLDGSGLSTATRIYGADGSYCAINFHDPDTMYMTTQYLTVRRTLNAGVNSQKITNSQLTNSDVSFINPLEMDVNNPEMIFQASRALWRLDNASTAGENDWVQCTPELSNSIISAIATSKSIPNLAYAAGGGVVYRIPDVHLATSTTQPTAVNPAGAFSGNINCIAVNPTDGNHIVVVFTNWGLATHVAECRNADQGANATWRTLQGNLPDLPVNWAVFEPDHPDGLLIGTDLGAFRCADITVDEADIYWSPERQGMGYPRIDMLEVRESDKTVHAATHGRGFFSTSSYNLAPQTDFGISTLNACGGQVQFFDSTTNAPTAWTWDFGDGTGSNLQSPVHQYATSGTYTVKLVSSNVNGTDSTTHSYNITVLPGVNVTITGDTSGCPNDTLQLQASGGISYQWSPEAGLNDPFIANPLVFLNSNRQYIVTVTDANGCVGTDTITVTAKPSPNVWAGQDKTISVVGDSVTLDGYGGITYLWTPSTGLDCDTCESPRASPAVTTVYTLTAWNAEGCSSSDNATVFVNIVSLDKELDPGQATLLGLFPNPFSERTSVRFYLPENGRVKFSVIGMDGALLREIDMGAAQGTQEIEIDRKGLAPGVYFLRMQAGEAVRLKKMVIL